MESIVVPISIPIVKPIAITIGLINIILSKRPTANPIVPPMFV